MNIPQVPLKPQISTDAKATGFVIGKRNRFWEVLDPEGELICMTVYKRGAKEVVRRLTR